MDQISDFMAQQFINTMMRVPPQSTSNKIDVLPNYSLRFHRGKYYIEIEMPGINPQNIKLEVKDDVLNLSIIKEHVYEFKDEVEAYTQTPPMAPPMPIDPYVPTHGTPINRRRVPPPPPIQYVEEHISDINLGGDTTYGDYVRGTMANVKHNYVTGKFEYKLILPYRVKKGSIECFYKYGVICVIVVPEKSQEFTVMLELA
jgi:HSP20 family molecular chaperone IbpA